MELVSLLLETTSVGMFTRQFPGVRDPITYQLGNTFLPIFRNVRASQVEKEASLETDPHTEQVVAMNSSVLYCQQYEVREGDRWYPDQEDDSYLIVTSVNRNQFKNLLVCTLEEDSR